MWNALFFFTGVVLAMALDALVGRTNESSRSGDNFELGQNLESARVEANDVEAAPTSPSAGVMDDDLVSKKDEPTTSAKALVSRGQKDSSLARVSFVTFLALTLHNLPEGVATFFGSTSFNWTIPLAIAFHNIPEGASIA